MTIHRLRQAATRKATAEARRRRVVHVARSVVVPARDVRVCDLLRWLQPGPFGVRFDLSMRGAEPWPVRVTLSGVTWAAEA